MRETKFRFRLKELTKEGYREWFKFYTLDDLVRGGGITTAEIIAKDLFTSLHDKNGKEIYEGDIMERKGNQLKPTLTLKVFWNNKVGSFQIGDWAIGHVNDPIEVIGNIYENKELLT